MLQSAYDFIVGQYYAEIRICKRWKRHVIILASKSTNMLFYTFERLFKSFVISRRACTAMYVPKVLLLQYVVALRQHHATLPEIGEAIQRIDGLSWRHGWENKVLDIMRRSGNRKGKKLSFVWKDVGTWCFVETYSPVNRQSKLLDISIICILLNYTTLSILSILFYITLFVSVYVMCVLYYLLRIVRYISIFQLS